MTFSENRLQWKVQSRVSFGRYELPCGEALSDGYNQGSGIKKNAPWLRTFKSIVWPLYRLRNGVLVDGFIERAVGRLIRKYVSHESIFLEVGCGDMGMRRFLPKGIWYNAFDLQLRDWHLTRVLKEPNVNIALASATNIPLLSNSASLIVSTETFEHIPEIGAVFDEIHRIAAPGAHLLCSIPNNYCIKYKRKGPHPGHVNNWTFEGFKLFAKEHGFVFVEGCMKGRWIPLPVWLTETSYQLPVTSKAEALNTNFFYVFEAVKEDRPSQIVR